MFNLKKCRRHFLHYLPKSWHFLTCCTVRPQRKKEMYPSKCKISVCQHVLRWGEGTTVSVHSHWGLRQALRMDFIHWCINGQNYKQRRLGYKSPCNPTVTHESNEPTHTVHVAKTYMIEKQTFDDSAVDSPPQRHWSTVGSCWRTRTKDKHPKKSSECLKPGGLFKKVLR